MTIVDKLVVQIKADVAEAVEGIKRVKSSAKTMAVTAGASIKRLQTQLHHLGMKWQMVGMSAQMAGMNMSLAVAPILGALGLATKKAGDFETSLHKLKVITNATNEEMQIAKKTITELSIRYGISVEDLTETATEFGAIGYNLRDSLELTRQAANLSISGLGTMEQATTVLNQALQQYRFSVAEAGRLTDLFAYIANATTANVAGLSTSFGYVGTNAKQVGFSINEVASALGIIQGALQDASMAGTGFREIMNSLIDPSAEASKLIEDLGIQLRDETGAILPMADIIDNVKRATMNLNKAQKDQYLSTIFGVRGMTAMNALMIAGSDALRDLTAQTEQVGYATNTTNELLKSFGKTVGRAKAAIMALAREAGEKFLPVIREMIDAIIKSLPQIREFTNSFVRELIPAIKKVFTIGMDLLEWFNNLDSGTKKTIAKVLAFGTVFMTIAAPILLFTGLMTGVIGNILMLGSTLVGVASSIGGFIVKMMMIPPVANAVGAAISFMTGPIGIAIMAITGLAIAWKFNLFGIRDATAKAAAWIRDKITWVVDTISNFIDKVSGGSRLVKLMLYGMLRPIGLVVLAFKHWDKIKEYIKAVVDKLGPLKWLLEKISGLLGIHTKKVKDDVDISEKDVEVKDDSIDKTKEQADALKKATEEQKKLTLAVSKGLDSTNQFSLAVDSLNDRLSGLSDFDRKFLLAGNYIDAAGRYVTDLKRNMEGIVPTVLLQNKSWAEQVKIIESFRARVRALGGDMKAYQTVVQEFTGSTPVKTPTITPPKAETARVQKSASILVGEISKHAREAAATISESISKASEIAKPDVTAITNIIPPINNLTSGIMTLNSTLISQSSLLRSVLAKPTYTTINNYYYGGAKRSENVSDIVARDNQAKIGYTKRGLVMF